MKIVNRLKEAVLNKIDPGRAAVVKKIGSGHQSTYHESMSHFLTGEDCPHPILIDVVPVVIDNPKRPSKTIAEAVVNRLKNSQKEAQLQSFVLTKVYSLTLSELKKAAIRKAKRAATNWAYSNSFVAAQGGLK